MLKPNPTSVILFFRFTTPCVLLRSSTKVRMKKCDEGKVKPLPRGSKIAVRKFKFQVDGSYLLKWTSDGTVGHSKIRGKMTKNPGRQSRDGIQMDKNLIDTTRTHRLCANPPPAIQQTMMNRVKQ